MSVEKAFDPTVSRNASDDLDIQSDDIDIQDGVSNAAASSDIYADDAMMPPPLAGESAAPSSGSSGIDTDQLMSDVREKLDLADGKVRAFVEQRPLVALGGAVVAGFLIGRIVARR